MKQKTKEWEAGGNESRDKLCVVQPEPRRPQRADREQQLQRGVGETGRLAGGAHVSR